MTRLFVFAALAATLGCTRTSGAPAVAAAVPALEPSAVDGGRPLPGIDAGIAATDAGTHATGVSARPEADGGASDAPVLATLERTACFGSCPVYRVVVHADGLVEWHGERYVATRGDATARLAPARLRELEQAFSDAHFFELQETKTPRYITDQPTVTLSFTRGETSRTLKHDYGKPGWPIELKKLESDFDAIVGTQRWLKPTE